MTAGRTNSEQLSVHWNTPLKIIKATKELFNDNIELDPCSNNFSKVHAKIEYKLPNTDGLLSSWECKTIYVNPPYGKDKERGTKISDWIKKCAETHALYKSDIIALVPVATNTKHWKNYIWNNATSICFLYDSRLKFLINGQECGTGAPMACAVIYWGESYNKFKDIFSSLGTVVLIKEIKNDQFRTL